MLGLVRVKDRDEAFLVLAMERIDLLLRRFRSPFDPDRTTHVLDQLHSRLGKKG